MPKIKTKKSAAKRFKRTGTGKIKRYRAFASHLLSKKPRKRKRFLKKAVLVGRSDFSRIKPLIPYKTIGG